MALLTSADKALWRLALPMIFQYYRSSAWAGGYGGYRASRFADLSRRRRDRRNGDQLSLYAAAFSAHEYDGPDGPGVWCKDPLRLARALVQPLILAFGAGALIVLLRTPLIDFALHIVGGSDAVLEQARRFLEIRWLSAPASLANWSCWAGCWACSTPARR